MRRGRGRGETDAPTNPSAESCSDSGSVRLGGVVTSEDMSSRQAVDMCANEATACIDSEPSQTPANEQPREREGKLQEDETRADDE